MPRGSKPTALMLLLALSSASGCVLFPTTSSTRSFDERENEHLVAGENSKLIVEQIPGQRLRVRVAVEGVEKHYRHRSVTERHTTTSSYSLEWDLIEIFVQPTACVITLLFAPFSSKHRENLSSVPARLVAILPLITTDPPSSSRTYKTEIVDKSSWREGHENSALPEEARVRVDALAGSGQRVTLTTLLVADGPDFDLRSTAARAGSQPKSLIFTLDACDPPLTCTVRLPGSGF